MSTNVSILCLVDLIGAAIAFVFVAIIACVFDPIEDRLLATFS